MTKSKKTTSTGDSQVQTEKKPRSPRTPSQYSLAVIEDEGGVMRNVDNAPVFTTVAEAKKYAVDNELAGRIAVIRIAAIFRIAKQTKFAIVEG